MSDVFDQDLWDRLLQDDFLIYSDWVYTAANEQPDSHDLFHWLHQPLFQDPGTAPFPQGADSTLDSLAYEVLPNSLGEAESHFTLDNSHGPVLPDSDHETALAMDSVASADTVNPISLELHQERQVVTGDPKLPVGDARPSQHPEKTTVDISLNKKRPHVELHCSFKGCPEKRRFGRKQDLERHMLKHNRKTAFGCPVIACNRRGDRAFYRGDKLTAHLRSVHEDDELSSCPVPGCDKGPLQFDMLMVHILGHRSNEASEVIPLHTYAGKKRCPMKKCRIGRSPWMWSEEIPGLSGHLMAHDETERLEGRDNALNRGYDAVSGGLVCPICNQVCSEEPDFRQHLWKEHTALTGHGQLLVEAIVNKLGKERCDQWLSGRAKNISSRVECETCSCSIYLSGGPLIQFLKHPDTLLATDELYQHRREILRLFPDFFEHPIFNDVRRTN